MGVATGVSDDADRVDREVDGERLVHTVIVVGAAQFFDEDRVRATEHVEILASHFPDHAHGEAGSGKRVAKYQFRWKAEGKSHLAHLVLEQIAQGLYQLEVHSVRQAADIVVGFDDVRLAVPGGGGFNDVGIDRALGEPPDAIEFFRLALEHVDEGRADLLALGFGIVQTPQRLKKDIGGIDGDQARVENVRHAARKRDFDLFTLIQAQEAVVDEHAGELIADGAIEQRGGDAGVDAAGQSEHHPFPADGRAHFCYGALDDVFCCPQAPATADVSREAAKDFGAIARMRDLGVELHAEETPRTIRHGGDRRIRGAGRDFEIRRQRHDLVAVAHPHGQPTVDPEASEQAIGAVFDDVDVRAAELALGRGFDGAAELGGQRVHAIADAEHGDPGVEHLVGNAGRRDFGHGFRAAGENHSPRRECVDEFGGQVERVYLAIHPGLAHAAGDELRVLRSEVDDQQPLIRQASLRQAIIECGHARRSVYAVLRQSGSSAVLW